MRIKAKVTITDNHDCSKTSVGYVTGSCAQEIENRVFDLRYALRGYTLTLTKREDWTVEDDIDWEQRRYEIAKQALAAIMMAEPQKNECYCVKKAVKYATWMVSELMDLNSEREDV